MCYNRFMIKKTFLHILLATPLLISCGNNVNYNYEFSKDLEGIVNNTNFRDLYTSELELMMKFNNTFFVYITNSTCSSCVDYEPTANEIFSKYHFLTYKLDIHANPKEFETFSLKLGTKFADKQTEQISTPGLFIVHGNDVTPLQQSRVESFDKFSHTISGYKSFNQTYFINTNATNLFMKNPNALTVKDYVYVSFDFNNDLLLEYFKNTYQDFLKNIQTSPLINNYSDNENSMTVSRITIDDDGRIGVKNMAVISDTKINETSVEYIKSIMNS